MSGRTTATDFALTLLTTDPAWIRAAAVAGVQRVGVDIERRGKRARQRSWKDARISNHRLEHLRMVADHAGDAKVFARLNPMHAGTPGEVERAISLGAMSLMLPQFRSAAEAARFVDLVAGRAEVLLLVETAPALARIREIASVRGVDEIMVGLNDLHHELGLRSGIELAASTLLEHAAQEVRGAGVRFGFGGVSRPDAQGLPLPPDLLLARHAALGSGSAWIARSFFQGGLTPEDFPAAVDGLRRRLAWWFGRSPRVLAVARRHMREAIEG
jgi:hypothetical protein